MASQRGSTTAPARGSPRRRPWSSPQAPRRRRDPCRGARACRPRCRDGRTVDWEPCPADPRPARRCLSASAVGYELGAAAHVRRGSRARRGGARRSPRAWAGSRGCGCRREAVARDGADELLRIAEDVAAEGAVAERGDEPRLGHRLVGGAQRAGHPRRDGPGDQQDVGVTRRGDDVKPVALQVVERVGDRAELVLAAVARAGVDVADAQASARPGRAAGACCAPDRASSWA